MPLCPTRGLSCCKALTWLTEEAWHCVVFVTLESVFHTHFVYIVYIKVYIIHKVSCPSRPHATWKYLLVGVTVPSIGNCLKLRCCVQRLRLSPKETTDGGSLKPDEVKRNRIIKRAAKEFQDGMYGILFMLWFPSSQLKTVYFYHCVWVTAALSYRCPLSMNTVLSRGWSMSCPSSSSRQAHVSRAQN